MASAVAKAVAARAARGGAAVLGLRGLATPGTTTVLPKASQPKPLEPPLTAERYHGLRRDPRFATVLSLNPVLRLGAGPRLTVLGPVQPCPLTPQLTEEDIAFFRSVLTDAGVEMSPDALDALNVDWLRKYRGQARVALKPKTTAEVSAVLRYCNDRRYAPAVLPRRVRMTLLAAD